MVRKRKEKERSVSIIYRDYESRQEERIRNKGDLGDWVLGLLGDWVSFFTIEITSGTGTLQID